MKELKRKIAERFFEDILDEDYALGIKEGIRGLSATVRVRLDFNRSRQIAQGMTKVQTIGYDKCVEALNDYLK